MNKKGLKTAEKKVSTRIWVRAAPESWSKYTTVIFGEVIELYAFVYVKVGLIITYSNQNTILLSLRGQSAIFLAKLQMRCFMINWLNRKTINYNFQLACTTQT